MSFRLLLLECVLYRTLSVSSSAQVTRNNVYHFHWLVGEWIYSHKPLATCCNAVQLEISFIETLIVLWWQRTCCSSDCGSRVVRKASEGNLETPTISSTCDRATTGWRLQFLLICWACVVFKPPPNATHHKSLQVL